MTLGRRFSVLLAFCLAVGLGSAAPAWASATTIDFESFTGPTTFGSAEPPLTVGVATFSGGLVMTAVNGLLADQSSVYGTADFCTGCASSIIITFSTPVDNVSLEVLNGSSTTATISYTVASNLGDSVTTFLGTDLANSAGTVTLPDSGITSVTISRTEPTQTWDFFIDNVSFTLPSPPFPTSTSDCKNGGWQTFDVFKNQGDCVSYVVTDGRNAPG
jgi:hypothetical protein